AAVTTAQGNGLDGLATGRAALGIAPGSARAVRRGSFFLDRRRLLAAVSRTASDLLPAFVVMNLLTARTAIHVLAGGGGGVAAGPRFPRGGGRDGARRHGWRGRRFRGVERGRRTNDLDLDLAARTAQGHTVRLFGELHPCPARARVYGNHNARTSPL